MTISLELHKTTAWLKRAALEDVAKTEVEDNVADGDNAEGLDMEADGKNVDDNIELEIAIEEYKRFTDGAGGKVIDGYNLDEVSGSYKRFVISGYDASTNPAAEATDNKLATIILMQNGLLSENGMNGVTIDDLLQVCEAIVEGYQEGKFQCEENGKALEHIREALTSLRARRERRSDQGTLDTHTPDSKE